MQNCSFLVPFSHQSITTSFIKYLLKSIYYIKSRKIWVEFIKHADLGNVAQSTRLERRVSSPSDLETKHSEIWGDTTKEDISLDFVGNWIWNKRCFRNRIVFILYLFFLLFWARNPEAHLILYKNKSQCKSCKTVFTENRGQKEMKYSMYV